MRYRAMNVVICAVAVAGSGCDSLIDVENPNQVTDADIRNDQAALGWANGALDAVLDAWDAMVFRGSMVSDETTFGSSRRAWNELDLGNLLDDLNNEALLGGYDRLAVASWMTREADLVLDSLDGEGELTDRSLMARTRFYRAYALTMVANWMDDFAFSDRTEPGPPVGPENK